MDTQKVINKQQDCCFALSVFLMKSCREKLSTQNTHNEEKQHQETNIDQNNVEV